MRTHNRKDATIYVCLYDLSYLLMTSATVMYIIRVIRIFWGILLHNINGTWKLSKSFVSCKISEKCNFKQADLTNRKIKIFLRFFFILLFAFTLLRFFDESRIWFRYWNFRYKHKLLYKYFFQRWTASDIIFLNYIVPYHNDRVIRNLCDRRNALINSRRYGGWAGSK